MKRLKIKILSIITLLLLVGCAPKPKRVKIMPPPEVKPPSFEVTGVSAEPRLFNPTDGETITISYRLSRPAKAIIKIFDPEMCLIKNLLPEDIETTELNKVAWDGRDFEERIVPDEAYFFTIEAMDHQGNIAFYDPTTFSGGEYFSPNVIFDPISKKVTYELPKDAWVRIRAGISEGPLLKTIVNWAPRFAGKNEESWDGKDESGNIDVLSQKGYRLMAEAITLPENSILTYGNSDYNYYEYKTEIAPERPKKRERPLFKSEKILMGSQLEGPREVFPRPKFRIQLPEDLEKTKDGLPILRGKTALKIVLDEEVKKIITEQRYEIIFFVDFKFISEEEGGYSPYTWLWDTRGVSNGKHIVTVNVATLTGEVESASLKVMVQN